MTDTQAARERLGATIKIRGLQASIRTLRAENARLREALKSLLLPFNRGDGTTGYAVEWAAIPDAIATLAAAKEEKT